MAGSLFDLVGLPQRFIGFGSFLCHAYSFPLARADCQPSWKLLIHPVLFSEQASRAKGEQPIWGGSKLSKTVPEEPTLNECGYWWGVASRAWVTIGSLI
jgi:hypothetical protein